ncbi:MAG: YaeQ family protein [Rhodocyclaceae bacterium]|nr:YaeQ family protein [Rhodocyclaceae bacterium]
MALKSTIFKVDLQIADLDRNYFQSHALTIARHPSETDERMMMRAMAFALHANDALIFGKGLSADDEPDLWQKDLTGAIELWIEVGLPDERKIRRACGRSNQVLALTYGGRGADMWWQQNQSLLVRQANLAVLNISQEDSKLLAAKAARNMSIQCTVQERELWLNIAGEALHIVPQVFK